MSLSFTLFRTRLLVAVLGALLVTATSLHAQRRKPVPSSEEERRLIAQGIVLHDEKQDIDGAIALFRKALELNRDNIDALFELSLCYYEKGAFRECLEIALRGAEYESQELGYFYNLIGNSYDELKQPAKAIAAYKEGIKLEPNSYLLRYNIGVTYLGTKRMVEARESFKHALVINPQHASSHIGLGQVYMAAGQRVPALLAFSRALVLEPTSSRGEATLRTVEGLLGIASGADPTPVKVGGSTKLAREEGKFQESEKVLRNLALTGERDDGMIPMERFIDRLWRVLTPIGAGVEKLGPGFAAEYYGPYVAELLSRGHLEAMAYHIAQSTPKEGVADWLSSHQTEVQSFLTWSRGFSWKRSLR